MFCKKCPHHVRYGKAGPKNKIIFSDLCGLKVKKAEPKAECLHFPFPKVFDYLHCEIYQDTFKTPGLRNDVVPTKDFQYSEGLIGVSITDMDLL